jgi:hypothetical protein
MTASRVRMRLAKCAALAVAMMLVLIWPTSIHGQEPGSPASQELPDAPRNDSDPTRAVFFSIRPELTGLDSDVTRSALIFRYDQAALRKRRWLPGQRGVILRFEVPIAYARIGARESAGLGDAYAQLLIAPHLTSKFAYVVGTGLVLPTASDDGLGAGGWILAPAGGPVWFFRGRGLLFIKLQNSISVGHDPERPATNVFVFTPTLVRTFAGQWWALADTETRTNWLRDGRTGFKSGLQIGRALGSRAGVWVKPEAWWGPNQDGSWNLKFGLVWYRP